MNMIAIEDICEKGKFSVQTLHRLRRAGVLPPLLSAMVVLALVLLVVGEYLASQNGTCLGCQYGTIYGVVFATFRQCRILGYKNGTFNAA